MSTSGCAALPSTEASLAEAPPSCATAVLSYNSPQSPMPRARIRSAGAATFWGLCPLPLAGQKRRSIEPTGLYTYCRPSAVAPSSPYSATDRSRGKPVQFPHMRIGTIVIASLWAGSGLAAEPDCSREDVRHQAECLTDASPPGVIARLYQLAVASLHGKPAAGDFPEDFLYIAEEAGEAARRQGLKPLVQMTASTELAQLAFSGRAITAYLDSVEHGYSHNHRFGDKGDEKLFAEAKTGLAAPCKRLAKHQDKAVQEEGRRCLQVVERPNLPAISVADLDKEFAGVGEPTGGGSLGGIRAGGGGLGLPVPEAEGSYRRRCDDRDGKGCHLLAELNRFERFGPGRTHPKDLTRAVELYQRGCDLGFAQSCHALATMLRQGKEVAADPARASTLDKRACSLGFKKACP
jgi:TPR repeat protein